jgi:NAD(P)H-dependent FMN reductase
VNRIGDNPGQHPPKPQRRAGRPLGAGSCLGSPRCPLRTHRPPRLPAPALGEPLPPSLGAYQNEHTKQWAAKTASFDGFVIVTPEYNQGTSGVLKNAIDYLYAEWNNKAVGFVSYGSADGARAVEHLRLVAGELQMADVRQQVVLSLMTEFENFSVFKPGDYNLPALNTMLDQVVAWSTALARLRDTAGAAA